MNDTYGNTSFSETSKNLLARLRAKEITLPEFLRECAFWALRCGFDEIMPLSFPTPPNSPAFLEYEVLPPERRAKVDPEFFHKNPEINSYYNQVFFVRHRNITNLGWLQEIKRYLPEDDVVLLKKLEDRIFEFQAFFDENSLMAEKIKNTFYAKEIKPKTKSYSNVGDIIGDGKIRGFTERSNKCITNKAMF